jgi:hypothetical protein
MPLILGTNSIKDTGYNVANSLRFNSGSTDYLSKTFGTATNTKKFTWSFWVKRTNLGANQYFFENVGSHTYQGSILFDSNDRLQMYEDGLGSGSGMYLITNRKFRDISAWYHIVIAVDSTQSTSSNRAKFFVNGTQETSFQTSTYPSQDHALPYISGSGDPCNIGKYDNTNSNFDGYLCEVVFCDGQTLAPTDFGEFDEDSPTIWKPIDVSGLTFGTNGFYLEFKQSGTSQNSSGLGADTSGQDNHFAVNNLTSVDQSIDTCTNNFATGNPIAAQGGSAVSNSLLTFSEGNLLMAANSETGIANFGLSSGKWFWEVKVIADQDGLIIGAVNQHYNLNAELGYNSPASATGAKAFGYYGGNGTATVVIGDGSGFSSYGSAIAVNNIIGVALDLDSADQSCTFYLNGSSQGALDITNLDAGEFYFPAVGNWSVADASTSWNFGSPQFSISSGNSDANGYGNFEYSVPSGYYSINSKNLAEFG